jgi:hypothetical protein
VTRATSRKRNPKSDGTPKDVVRGNHPDTLESKRDLLGQYVKQSRYKDGERLLKQAFEDRETKVGPDTRTPSTR